MSLEDKTSSPREGKKKASGKKEKPPQPELAKSEDGEKGGADSENGDVVENAYVTVMSKKIRGLRKKMERARSLELQLTSGKVSHTR